MDRHNPCVLSGSHNSHIPYSEVHEERSCRQVGSCCCSAGSACCNTDTHHGNCRGRYRARACGTSVAGRETMNESDQGRKGVRVVTVMGIVAILLFVAGTFVAYRLLIQAPAELAQATADGFRSLFQVTPRVTVNETVIIEQTSSIIEIATVSRPLLVDHEWSDTWLGSTKSLRVRGTFTAKAGFDLKKPFEIVVGSSPLRVTARLPRPELLSLQMDSFEILRDEERMVEPVDGRRPHEGRHHAAIRCPRQGGRLGHPGGSSAECAQPDPRAGGTQRWRDGS